MFGSKKKQDIEDAKAEMSRLLKEMRKPDISYEGWKELKEKYLMLDQVVYPSGHVNVNTVLPVAGSLLGILAILHFEKLDIITSKAVGFILKPKL